MWRKALCFDVGYTSRLPRNLVRLDQGSPGDVALPAPPSAWNCVCLLAFCWSGSSGFFRLGHLKGGCRPEGGVSPSLCLPPAAWTRSGASYSEPPCPLLWEQSYPCGRALVRFHGDAQEAPAL